MSIRHDRMVTINSVTADLIEAMRKELDRVTRTCINCDYFIQDAEKCSKYNNQRPPARIIAAGCDGHADLIPF